MDVTIPAGSTGSQGPTGTTGPAGAAGATGVAGATPTLAVGTVTTGAAGSSALAAVRLTGTNAYAIDLTIPQGAVGATGPQGPKSSVKVCSTTLALTSLISLSSGVTTKTGIACTGVLTTDLLEVYPTAQATFPDGIALHHAFATAANTMKVVYSAPAVTLLQNYSIPVDVYAVNR